MRSHLIFLCCVFFLICIVADCRFWDNFVKLQQVDCQLYLYWIQPHCEKSSLEWFIISLLRSLGSGHDVNYFFTELTFSWEPNNFAVTFKYLLFICLFIFPCQSNYNCKIIVYNSILTFFKGVVLEQDRLSQLYLYNHSSQHTY